MVNSIVISQISPSYISDWDEKDYDWNDRTYYSTERPSHLTDRNFDEMGRVTEEYPEYTDYDNCTGQTGRS